MEFGKADRLDGLVVTPPPDDPRTAATLANAAGSRGPHAPQVHVGPTGWAMKEWVGRIYPRGTTSDAFLAAYGTQFTTVELNTTWYREPDAPTIARWRDAVPDGFRFAPKFPQEVVNLDDVDRSIAGARTFCERVRGLGDRLGRSFVQLAPNLGPERRGELSRLLDAIDVPVAVEFRHPGWFVDRRLGDAAFRFLADRGAAAVITDVLGRRDVVHASLPAPALFLRFVGNGRHALDDRRLADWSQRIARWLGEGLAEAWIFAHEPDNLLAPELTNAWIDRLNADAGLSLRKWTTPKARGQMTLF